MTVTLVSGGRCTLRADQAGNAVFPAAEQVVGSFFVTPAPQVITITAPTSAALAGSVATVSAVSDSLLPVTLSSATTDVCTIANGVSSAGSSVTVALVRSGTCTLHADQAGNVTFAAAPQATASIAVLPGAPQVITLTPPANTALEDGPATASATSDSGLPVTLTSATTGICTISNGVSTAGSPVSITLVSRGKCILHANQSGGGIYAPAAQVTGFFLVTPVTSTITFTAPPDTPRANNTVTASATSDSGLPVTLTSATTGVCTIADGVSTGGSAVTVTLVAGGKCTLNADQAGSGPYAAAERVTRSFWVTPAPQVITFTPPADTPKANNTVTASATSNSGLPVTLTSATTDVCTIPGSGVSTEGSSVTVTLVKAGKCTLQADQAGGGPFAAAERVPGSFWVTPVPQVITFTAPADTPRTNNTVTASATSDSGLPVTLTSATTGVCTIANGVSTGGSAVTVTLVGNGKCTLNADQSGNNRYSAATRVSGSFWVTPVSQVITFTQPANAALSAETITASATSSLGLPVTLTSVTLSVCSVLGSGISTAGSAVTIALVGAGSCTLHADQAGGGAVPAATTVERSFSVSIAAPSAVQVTPEERQLSVSWSPPDPLIGVRSYTATAGGRTCSTADADTTTCTITGLAPGTQFMVTVVANGASGVSEASAEVPGTPLSEPIGSVVSNADGRLQAFTKGALNHVYTSIRSTEDGTWSPLVDLGGIVLDTPVVVRNANGKLQVFILGTDNGVRQRMQVAPNSAEWTAWTKVANTPFLTGIRAQFNENGKVQLFARGADKALWTTVQTTAGGTAWSTWTSLGGVLVSDVTSVIRTGGRIEVFATFGGGLLYHRLQSAPNSQVWLAWAPVGGATNNASAVRRSR